MLAAIGAKSTEDLFDEIPPELRIDHLHEVPEALSEMEISRLMRDRGALEVEMTCRIRIAPLNHSRVTATALR